MMTKCYVCDKPAPKAVAGPSLCRDHLSDNRSMQPLPDVAPGDVVDVSWDLVKPGDDATYTTEVELDTSDILDRMMRHALRLPELPMPLPTFNLVKV